MRTVDGDELILNLVLQAQHCWSVRGNQSGVNGGPAISQVVCLDLGRVICGSQEANPVGAVGRGPAGPRRVAKRVCGGRLGALGVKPSLGIGISTREGS
jgi:hypothetical protein